MPAPASANSEGAGRHKHRRSVSQHLFIDVYLAGFLERDRGCSGLASVGNLSFQVPSPAETTVNLCGPGLGFNNL